jgi:magnesium-transporting ATPase (P-type)
VVSRLFTRLARQHNTSPRIGGILNIYQSTSIIFTPLSFLGIATTLWGLWGAEIIQQRIPWFTYPMLILVMVFCVLLAMVFWYKIIMPSSIAFSVQQSYLHRNPLVTDMGKALEEMGKVLEELEAIKKHLGMGD